MWIEWARRGLLKASDIFCAASNCHENYRKSFFNRCRCEKFDSFSIWQVFNWISSYSSHCCLTLFRLSSRHNSISYCCYVSSTPPMTSSKYAEQYTSIGLLNRLRNIYRAGECPAHQQFGLLALEIKKQKELLLFVSPFIPFGSLLFMAMVGCKSEITNIISNDLEMKATAVWCLVSIELINCFSAFSQSSSST